MIFCVCFLALKVTKKSDLSDFYFNLGKNVAFGAKDIELRKQEKQTELRKPEKQDNIVSADTSDGSRLLADSKSDSQAKEVYQSETSPRSIPDSLDLKAVSDKTVLDTSIQEKTVSDATIQEKTSVEQPLDNQPKLDHHKRNEDALAAAKERFLARKRAKQE